MTESEKDYSDYLQHMSNNLNGLFLFSGFTLTTITVLVSILPDPTVPLAQITLFFLFVMFSVFLFQIVEIGVSNLSLIKDVPPLTTGLRRFNWIFFLSQSMWGISIILMFLLSELIYLALVSAVTYAGLASFVYVTILRPFMKKRALWVQREREKEFMHKRNSASSAHES